MTLIRLLLLGCLSSANLAADAQEDDSATMAVYRAKCISGQVCAVRPATARLSNQLGRSSSPMIGQERFELMGHIVSQVLLTALSSGVEDAMFPAEPSVSKL